MASECFEVEVRQCDWAADEASRKLVRGLGHAANCLYALG